MDPQQSFCPNWDCPARGQLGAGNIGIHSQKEKRYQCTRCKKTFAATTGTVFYRLQTPRELVTVVITLLCHGCPIQAIVAAFGLDERTVARWFQGAGQHSQALHTHLVQQEDLDLQHVQADELYAKQVGKRVWMALALAAPTRLWLGGVISPRRDGALITRLVEQVHACARKGLSLLVCVDGLASYVTAFRKVFRYPVRTGRRGRPRLKEEPGLLLAQVVKSYHQRRVREVSQRVVQGTREAVMALLQATGTGNGIHTAYIERLNATFRAHLATLVRRGRALAHQEAPLTAGMALVGCAYNFCWEHDSLRIRAASGNRRRWLPRTPAMAAGLTDHRWKMGELLGYQVPPPAWVPPKRRGRPPKPKPPVGASVA